MAAMQPDDERAFVIQLITGAMTSASLITGWHLVERSFVRGTYRLKFERPLLDGSDPITLISVRARFRWDGVHPRKLAYSARYRTA